VTVSVVIGGVLVPAMICIAGYGAVTLPREARIPLHWGPRSYNTWAPKPVGLVLWPAAGLAIWILLFVSRHDAAAHGSHGGPVAIIMPAVLAAVACAEAGAMVVSRRRSGVAGSSGL
jgi:hypothetical protein